MPRPGRNYEKSKDFKGSMKKLLVSLKPWHIVIALSIVLAMSSAIISLIAPNRLSDLTNYVTEGLQPNITEETITSIMTDSNISPKDSAKFYELLESSETITEEELLQKMDELPESVYEHIKPTMDISAIQNIALLLAILYVTSALFGYIQQLIMAKVTNNYAKSLRTKITIMTLLVAVFTVTVITAMSVFFIRKTLKLVEA